MICCLGLACLHLEESKKAWNRAWHSIRAFAVLDQS